MSKGSGRRRTTPSDGIQYDPESDQTNVELRGSLSIEGITRRWLYSDPGAPPTARYFYGTNGRRWAGRGRKNDNRSWKTRSKGKQYEVNSEL